MKIQIHSFSPNPVELCAKSSYISHSEMKITDIFNGNTPKDSLKYLTKIVKMGHLSVLEHASFNILIEDAPVVFEIFAIKFRLASFTVKSRRYTDVIKDGFFKVRNPLDESFLNKIKTLYKKLIDSKIPLEDARFILPYSFKTNMILTMNARELGYMLYCALHENKVEEIKEIATQIIENLKDIFPLFTELLDSFKKETKELNQLNFQQNQFFKARESVELLSSTDNAETIYQEALNFMNNSNYYSSDFIDEDLITDSMLISHNRALELIQYTFYLRDISLAGLTHLLRHRIQTPILGNLFSSQLNYNIIMPESIKNSQLKEDYLDLCRESAELERKSGNFYYRLVAASFPVLISLNLRELYLFFKLRLCNRAQWEIRELAEDMLKLCKEKNPLLFKNAGPSCVLMGYCPEGSHTCGKMTEIREKFLGQTR